VLVLVSVVDRTAFNTTSLQHIVALLMALLLLLLSSISSLSSVVGQFDFDEVAHDFPSPRTGEPSLFPFNAALAPLLCIITLHCVCTDSLHLTLAPFVQPPQCPPLCASTPLTVPSLSSLRRPHGQLSIPLGRSQQCWIPRQHSEVRTVRTVRASHLTLSLLSLFIYICLSPSLSLSHPLPFSPSHP
jgi:hypothetical protein